MKVKKGNAGTILWGDWSEELSEVKEAREKMVLKAKKANLAETLIEAMKERTDKMKRLLVVLAFGPLLLLGGCDPNAVAPDLDVTTEGALLGTITEPTERDGVEETTWGDIKDQYNY